MNTFYNCLMYYSRIPVPKSVKFDAQTLSRSLMFFPLVGLIVGALGYAVFWASTSFLPFEPSLILSMGAMMLCTGGMHEDGWADFLDGFGGGYTKEAILRIMKDSHIGTYGVLGLILMLGFRFFLLDRIDYNDFLWVMILAQGASRLPSVLMVHTAEYARDENSKSSHSALGISRQGVIVAGVIALCPLLLLGWSFALICVVAMFGVFNLFKDYIYRKIGGYTGDTLGALQQISEVVFYSVYFLAPHLF